ncbi:MAG: hypothetical protein WB799_16805 [Candidatus Sulfotelmatobacter sp.]
MSISEYPSPANSRTWRELYKVALFETDKHEIPVRIANAEKAIKQRAKQLFSTSNDSIEEDQALDDALYALHALQNCLGLESKAGPDFAGN